MHAPSKKISLYIDKANQRISNFCKEEEKAWMEWYLAYKIEDIISHLKLVINSSTKIVMTNSTNLILKKLYDISNEANMQELRDHFLLLQFVLDYMQRFDSADVLLS